MDLKKPPAVSRQYSRNIEKVTSLADIQDGTLGQAHDLIVRAKELLLKEANEVASTAATREATRVEIAILVSELAQVANTRFNNQYIYSGFQSDAPAFLDVGVNVIPNALNSGGAAVTGQEVAVVSQVKISKL
jgi:flagellin-like hook-associated protein FlgL